jgi:outer membrane protein assembly factor BamB
MIRSALIVLLLSLIASCCVRAQEAPTSAFELVSDERRVRVTRYDAKGKVVWSVNLDGETWGLRPPHLLWDERRVYFTHNDGVTALDVDNGKTLWHAPGPEQGMLLSDGLLLGTGSLSNKDGTFSHWLYACDLAKGNVTFKTQLPQEMSDPEAVHLIAGFILVQIGEAPGGKGSAILFDRKGTVRHRFDRQVVNGMRFRDEAVFLTSNDVVRVTAKDKVAWTIPFDRHQWIAGGELIDLPDGDVIVFRFGCINDSGVSVIRFDPSNGKEKWKANCRPLGVSHSKYCHAANVSIAGEKLRVTSKGSSTFVEILDLKTGSQIQRFLKKD